MAFQDDINKFNSEIASIFTEAVSVFDTMKAELIKVLGIAEADAPAVLNVLSTVGAISAMVPGLGGIGSVVATASNFITEAEGWMKGADGVIASAGSAIQPAVALTNAEKRQAVANATNNLHPDALTHQVDLATTVAYTQIKKIVALSQAAKP